MPWIELHNWKVYYERSASSGVRLRTCDYQGTRVVYGASVPFVYVQYQGTGIGPFTDELDRSALEYRILSCAFGTGPIRATVGGTVALRLSCPWIMVFCAFTDGEDIIETLGWICPQGLPPTLQNIKPASITPRGWLTFRPAGPKTAPGVELVA